MGFFGNGGNSGAQGQSESDKLVDEEIKRNAAESQAKKEHIYQERLELIHAQGNQDWHSKG
jgi:hypothetical protein